MIIRQDRHTLTIAWATVHALKCRSKLKSVWGDNKTTTDKSLVQSMEGIKRTQ